MENTQEIKTISYKEYIHELHKLQKKYEDHHSHVSVFELGNVYEDSPIQVGVNWASIGTVSPEKAEEFLNRKADPKVKEMILKRAEKLKKQRENFSSFEETEPEQCRTAAKKQCRNRAGFLPFQTNTAKQNPRTAADSRRDPERPAPKKIDTDQAYSAKPEGKPQEPAHSCHALFPEISSLP